MIETDPVASELHLAGPTQIVFRQSGDELHVDSEARERDGDVGLATAERGVELAALGKSQLILRGKPEHDLAERHDFRASHLYLCSLRLGQA